MRIETLIYFLLWAVLIVAMMRFGCGAHVLGHSRHRHGRSSPSGDVRWIPPEKDTDPVCGMTVETAKARSSVYGGYVYYFCSQDCRDKFEASPADFAKGPATTSRPMEHVHGN